MWANRLDMEDIAGGAERISGLQSIPDLVLVFGETGALKTSGVLNRLKTLFPDAVQLGCSTGTFEDGTKLSDEGLMAIAVGFADTRIALHVEMLPEIIPVTQAWRWERSCRRLT